MRTMSTEQCRSSYGYRRDQISENMICALETWKGPCNGDSGGPLAVLGEDKSYRLVGVVSWGRYCALPGYPGVYTRVTSLLGWIREQQLQQPPPPLRDQFNPQGNLQTVAHHQSTQMFPPRFHLRNPSQPWKTRDPQTPWNPSPPLPNSGKLRSASLGLKF